ncbi:glycine cleavage system protein GcvH [Desulfotomaculum defluvii]
MTKPLDELTFPNDIHYFEEHTWVRIENDLVKIGISDFAQDNLGNIIFIELPNAGEIYSKGDEFGQAESAKTVSALYMPISGVIVAVNTILEEGPQTVNESPYEEGWMIKVKPSNLADVGSLLSKDEYIHLIK